VPLTDLGGFQSGNSPDKSEICGRFNGCAQLDGRKEQNEESGLGEKAIDVF